MKKALIALLLLLTPALVFGQGGMLASDGVSSTAWVYGQKVLIAIPGASITVCSIPVTLVNGACTNKVALYSDFGMTQSISNPTTLDTNSNYSFYAANTILQYTVTNKGVSSGPYFVRTPGQGGGGGTGTGTTLPPYTQFFTDQTTVTIPGSVHGYRTMGLITACYDNASPAHKVEPAQLYVNTLTYDVTVLFASPQSGLCVVNGGDGSSSSTNGIINVASALWTGSDIGAKFNSALAIMGCGEYVIPAGAYSFATTFNKARCVDLHGQGAGVTTLNHTGAGVPFVVADTNGGYIKGGIYDLKLIGSGLESAALFLGGDPAGILSPIAAHADMQTFRGLDMSGFAQIVKFGNNAWLDIFDDSGMHGNTTVFGPDAPGATNSGEMIIVTNSAIYNNGTVANGFVHKLKITNTSLDYNGGGTTAVLLDTGFECHDCYFEQTSGPISNSSNVKMYGGSILLGGTTGTDPYLFQTDTGATTIVLDGVDIYSSHAVTEVINYLATSYQSALTISGITGNGNGLIAGLTQPGFSCTTAPGINIQSSMQFAANGGCVQSLSYNLGTIPVLANTSGNWTTLFGRQGQLAIRPGTNQTQWTDTALNLGSGTSIQIGGNTVVPAVASGFHGTAGTKVQLSDGTGVGGNLVQWAADGSTTASGIPASGVLRNCGTLTTTAAASDAKACAWVTTSSTCTVTPITATSPVWSYAAPSAGSVTVFHASTAIANAYAIACSAN